ncbi:hypothetical protein KG112_02290 [Nocardioides sp. zg-ZUI104]|uniref:HtaA domain-containing protein n=1 Tax=Nocardioides faecalis TaxID=2803858 RepID=UPI001BCBE68A|nr:HtaA domain-containing protein [Nocardioides faecalis]MBS4751635.1 hypothetical protein [Nocardioides faecalis]
MSSLTPRRRSRLRATVAATAAAGVTAAGLSLVPGAFVPANADAANAELRWEISGWFDNHLSTHSYAGGVTEDGDGVLTFGGGERSVVDGVEQVQYDGAVTGAFEFMGTRHYSITVKDPVVVVDGNDGAIKATVSATVDQAPDTAPALVTLTTFDVSAASRTTGAGLDTLTATPRWADVLPTGTAPAELELAADRPLEGKSWDVSLLKHLPSSLRAHFHKTGTSASQETKAPAQFSAEIPTAAPAPAAPKVRVATTAQSAAGATVKVDGTGFVAPVTGAAGIYVVVGKAGGRPQGQSAAEGIKNSVAAAWLANTPTPGATGVLKDGAFSLSLNLPAAKLAKGQAYSVYTFQAHLVADASYDTETRVVLDGSKIFPVKPAATTAKIKVSKVPTTKKKGKVVITVTGGAKKPSGKVKVTYNGGKLKGKKVKVSKTVRLGANGTVSVTLPKSAKGKRTVKVKYLGTNTHKATKTVSKKINVKK